MRFAPLPEAVRAEIVAGYAALGADEPPVAVRSSAIGEDSAEATFAGQQESFLWVRGADAGLRRRARLLGQPLHAAGDELSRKARRRDAAPAMGVTVQLMVDAEVSGVLFTCNPVSGDPSMVAVNASWGLGLAVVGGEVTPDDYLVSKVTGEVVRRQINASTSSTCPDAGGRGTVRVEVAADRQDEPCLGEEELAALVEVARRVERHFGSHQDVEWALARGRSLPDRSSCSRRGR